MLARDGAGGKVYDEGFVTKCVADVGVLKKAGRLVEAEELLLKLVAATEAEDAIAKKGVTRWYYEQLAIIYRKCKDPAKEVAILERCLAKVGRTAGEDKMWEHLEWELPDRLKKARALLVADSAKPVSPCPHCGIEMTPPSKTTGKCPACGEKVVRAKRPGEEFASLFTVEQAEENKKGVELARARKRELDNARVYERGVAYERGKKLLNDEIEAGGIDTQKSWVIREGDVCEICRANASVGWIRSSDRFPDGSDTGPAHVGCRCFVGYRVSQDPEDLKRAGIDPKTVTPWSYDQTMPVR
jgi:predicted RNA-binding Zn-ribbon protein involved in translation (DUF1610 family)